MNAERAAKHARRLQKASSQGARPDDATQAASKPVDEIHKVRLNTQGEDSQVNIVRRKAGSGTRVEQAKATAD